MDMLVLLFVEIELRIIRQPVVVPHEKKNPAIPNFPSVTLGRLKDFQKETAQTSRKPDINTTNPGSVPHHAHQGSTGNAPPHDRRLHGAGPGDCASAGSPRSHARASLCAPAENKVIFAKNDVFL